MMNVRLLHFAAAMAAFVTGCGCGRENPPMTHKVKIDVGGGVVYAPHPAERLAGVTVTLTNLEGAARTTVSNDAGLWTIENVLPGVYFESYQAPGYETVTGAFGLDAMGKEDVKNVFVSRPDVAMQETRLRATVSAPIAATLISGDAPVDGFAGNVLVYRPSVDGAVMVTFSRRLVDGEVRFFDQLSGEQVGASRSDTATETTFTVQAEDLDGLNGGSGVTTDSDPQTFDRLTIQGDSFTPIHGDAESFGAVVQFNAAP